MSHRRLLSLYPSFEVFRSIGTNRCRRSFRLRNQISLPLVEAGSLRLLAVAASRRLPTLPDMPTIAETLPGFEAVAWYAIMAPPNTPKNITARINADVNEALRQPELQERLRKLSAETYGGSIEKTAKYLQEEVERWGNVIKAANVKLQ